MNKKEYRREYYINNRFKLLAQHEEYRNRNKERIKEYDKQYREKNKQRLAQLQREYYQNNPNKAVEHSKKVREKVRDQVFDILGTRKCIKCGFSDIRALQFDHINGDGGKLGYRLTFYRDNPEFTKKTLQVLCANCNFIKRHFRGEYKAH